MALTQTSIDQTCWLSITLPAIVQSQNLFERFVLFIISIAVLFLVGGILTWVSCPGGLAWKNGRNRKGAVPITGPKGLPFFGSLLTLTQYGLAYQTLSSMAKKYDASKLMAFSLGSTPAVVTSDPQTAREILTSSHFANRPVKLSARKLMFNRAIGFAPNDTYWRLLRRISSNYLFAPTRIAAHDAGRRVDSAAMISAIAEERLSNGVVVLRKHLQAAALNNIMGMVFGKRYEFGLKDGNENEANELQEIVKEGFEILGAFNWSDYLPWLSYFYDPSRINQRCAALVPRVKNFVHQIIQQHRINRSRNVADCSDFVHVLLSLDGDEKLNDDDMVAILWEMIFRGTDTTALLTEWIMAELILNPDIQSKLHEELVMDTHADLAKLPYLQAVIKETLRLHPPGPLLSWARLSMSDVQLSNGMVVPADTTAMVNMWSITHDPNIWEDPLVFRPDRFVRSLGGVDVDVRGSDLRLAPFGAGRRVCPGKNLGLVTVSLWVAELVRNFEWVQDRVANPVDLTEVLKLSCEMKNPLAAIAIPRDLGEKKTE